MDSRPGHGLPRFSFFGGSSLLLIKKISLILLCVAPKLWASSCHPMLTQGQRAYLIAYGSLISDVSRERTMPEHKRQMPIWVQGWQRGFFKQSAYQPGATFLGVKRMAHAHFNATLFMVRDADLQKADRREGGYCRQQVARGDLVPMQGVIPAGSYWMYVPKEVRVPDASHPIVQSYVDRFLGGCLAISHHFAKLCVNTTHDWSVQWVNDRIYPRRPWMASPKAMAVDQLLQSMGVNGFSHRRIE